MKKSLLSCALTAALAVGATSASATPFTETSPTSKGAVPSGITAVGGVVLDMVGTNGVRVISQLSATSLFVGYADSGTPAAYRGNPFTVGIQSGFTPAIISALGGGLSEVGIRFTLYDGDSASGNFDYGDLTLLVNGVYFGNWSDVNAQATDNTGTTAGSMSGGGFRNNLLDTGWFFNNSATTLASFYATLTGGSVTYAVNDTDPYDNYYNFSQGVAGGLINVGTGPVVIPPNHNPVPEPASLALLGLGLAGLGVMRRRRA